MSCDLSCNTIRDLLPIYLDGIASKETNICVNKHLSECQQCQNEYKKLCKISEEKRDVVISESASIKTLRKKLIFSFITVIILGVTLVSIAAFCSYSKLTYTHSSFFQLVPVIILYVGIYFLPLLAILIAVIWKNTIPKKEKKFWPNVIILFLVIWVLTQVSFLLWQFFSILWVC
ncbi:Putative zinc-finger [Clostridium amylolyticum]|uniref:Putative zinc-finger n=1 Tax=Clostridium amylolyticum TaxID=1121298 RepID=A0A1M6MZF5_9CLOT|nr:zf-HC2 domain-containing protein [Clostridium amylolyticum]SHJ88790.1 Putative zinc-finger [Clostridium amylolyticum]